MCTIFREKFYNFISEVVFRKWAVWIWLTPGVTGNNTSLKKKYIIRKINRCVIFFYWESFPLIDNFSIRETVFFIVCVINRGNSDWVQNYWKLIIICLQLPSSYLEERFFFSSTMYIAYCILLEWQELITLILLPT